MELQDNINALSTPKLTLYTLELLFFSCSSFKQVRFLVLEWNCLTGITYSTNKIKKFIEQIQSLQFKCVKSILGSVKVFLKKASICNKTLLHISQCKAVGLIKVLQV